MNSPFSKVTSYKINALVVYRFTKYNEGECSENDINIKIFLQYFTRKKQKESIKVTKRSTKSQNYEKHFFVENGGEPSFNSSGRSSNCDEGDMQSDISLEEDVNDLNHKVIVIFV